MGCAEYLTVQVFTQTVLRYGHIEQGNIGEEIANELATDKLGFSQVGFAPAKHGLDGVFRDSKGSLVVVDSKCTTGSPFSALHTTNHGTQLTSTWIGAKAACMQNPNSAQYTPQNARVGSEIQQALNRGEVRTMLVHSNPETMEVTAYELVGKDVTSPSSWQTVASWQGNIYSDVGGRND